jgi:hypothetical protein
MDIHDKFFPEQLNDEFSYRGCPAKSFRNIQTR